MPVGIAAVQCSSKNVMNSTKGLTTTTCHTSPHPRHGRRSWNRPGQHKSSDPMHKQPPLPVDSPSGLSSGNEARCTTTTEAAPHRDTTEHPSPYSTSPGIGRSTSTETTCPTPVNPSMNNTLHPVPNRLRIWQQNLNKSRVAQEDLINSEVYKEYDLLILQEPYIDSYGNTKATRDWRVTYPSSFLSRNHVTRSVMLI